MIKLSSHTSVSMELRFRRDNLRDRAGREDPRKGFGPAILLFFREQIVNLEKNDDIHMHRI
jgi:hypothetical protein